MKKHLFLIASVFAAVSLQAQAVVSVASDTGVKVKPNTLFYVGGQMKVANYNGDAKKVSNEGKVKIAGNLVNGNDTDGSNFVNEYVGTGKYGQLIVNASSDDNVGKISSGVKFQESGFVFYPIAIPYKNIKAESVVEDLLGKEAVAKAFAGYHGRATYRRGFDKNRIPGNALFFWDNDNYLLEHVVSEGDIGVEGTEARYYAINNSTISKAGTLKHSAPTHIKGTPLKSNVEVILNRYDVLVSANPRKGKSEGASATDNKNIGVNKYGEAYGSYIIDFNVEAPAGWENYYTTGEGVSTEEDFGLRIYNIGNPYTSNVNLGVGKDGVNKRFWDHVEVLVQYGSQNYDAEINNPYTGVSGSYGKNFAGLTKEGAGDEPLGFVAPFQTFAVKMKNTMPSKVTFTFNDEMKTFNEPVSGKKVNSIFAKSAKQRGVEINQVGLDLLDANKNKTGVRTYVVASDVYEAAQMGEGTEVYNIGMSDEDTGIYTLQENEDGTVNERLADNKSYINGINADKYIAKPVYLVFQNGKGQYTLKARLNESLENNKNAFYFEDKATGKVQKVTKDFEYTFNVNGTEKDRFVLYWAATPNNEKVEEVAKQEVNTTVVFKDADTYKVRFDKEIKKADVFVYNISGQLINTERNINTSVDYIVPLKGNSSVYIIKIVGDNGQVTTKKVIK